MKRQGSPPGLLFRLVVPATAIFIITIFALLVAPFSDQKAPLWKFLDRHADRLLLVEFVVIIVLSLFAMTWDRRRILQQSGSTTDGQDTSPGDRSPSADPRAAGESPDG